MCYHVLEHVPDDAAAMREIARVLSPRGLALLEVPIREGVATDEDPTAPPEECVRRFGQRDHVRWYGDDIDARFSAAGLATLRVTPPALLGEAAVEFFRLMRHEVVWIARPGNGSAPPMLAGGSGSGLTAAFDAVLGELARTREQSTGLARASTDRLAGSATPCALGSRGTRPRRTCGVLTRLRRVARL